MWLGQALAESGVTWYPMKHIKEMQENVEESLAGNRVRYVYPWDAFGHPKQQQHAHAKPPLNTKNKKTPKAQSKNALNNNEMYVLTLKHQPTK